MSDTQLTPEQFFDWMRDQQDNHRLSQDMVDGANELLALMSTNELQDALSKINAWDNHSNYQRLALSEQGIAMICEFEGFRSKPYLDIAGVPTIGYGNTYYINADGSRSAVTLQDKPVTKTEALALKQSVVDADFAPAVNLMFADEIKAGKISQNQFDALISLAYNIGIRGLKGSSIYKNIKAGDFKTAADRFLKWNKARVNGRLKPIKGLTRRRQRERELFLA